MLQPANLTEYKGGMAGLVDIVQAAPLVVVIFGTPWCPPCKRLDSEIPELAAERPTVVFLKVNVEDNDELSDSFDILSIPHVKYFRSVSDSGVPIEIESTIGANIAEIKEKVRRLDSKQTD